MSLQASSLLKPVRALLATAAFLLILPALHHAHIAFFRVDVVFYAALADVVLAAILAGLLLFGLDHFKPLGRFEKLQLVMIWLLTGYALAISVPTVIDRSLSFYILEKLQQRGGGIRQEAFEQVFTREYVKEHHLVEVRLTEQLQSGTIVIDKGCVLLTAKGSRIASFGRYYRRAWLPRQRLLMGRYGDELTDPFRNSPAVTGYECGPN